MDIFSGLTNLFKGWKDKDTIYNGSPNFFGFGGSKVSIKKIFTSSQDNKLLIDYFNNVAEVAAPILKYSEGAKQVIIKANIPEVQELIDKPNGNQGGDEFFSLEILQKRLFGNAFENAFTTVTAGSTPKPKKLFLFTPQHTAIQTSTEDDFRFREIEQYLFPKTMDKNIEIEPENMLHLKESNPNFDNNSYLFGLSRYVGCASAIQSLIGGYGAKVNLFENGPRFIITGKGQSEFASVNETEDIEKVQKRFSLYGWSKNKYNNWITDKPLDVTNASLNVGQLKLTEHNTADFKRLCDAQGIDVKVFSENGKFDDKALALSDFYNNAFRSEIDSTVKDKQNFYRQWWPDLELTVDYSNITEIVEAQDKENKRIFEDAKLGLITRNEYLEKTGQEPNQEKTFSELYTLDSQNQWRPINETGTQTIDAGTD